MDYYSNEQGENGLMLLPQPLLSLPENILILFVLTWRAAC